MLFWSDFWVLGPNFPMKPFREGHKILHEGSCINKELPCQIWRDSNHFCSHNEKNLHFHCFRGPFWTRLSTSWSAQHHDSYYPCLLHHEPPPTLNSSCCDLYLYQIFCRNTKKQPFLAFFCFIMSLQTVISQPFFGNMEWNFLGNL